MTKIIYLLFTLIFFSTVAFSQDGVLIDYEGNATRDPSAIIQLNSDNSANQGFLVPRVALTSSTSASPIYNNAPAYGLMVFNTASVNDVIPGFYFWNGSSWQGLAVGTGSFASGSGVQNYIAKWNNTAGTTLGNSSIFDNGTNVSIGTSNPFTSAILDITSTNKGLLPPRMTTALRNLINVSNNAGSQGLMIFNTTTNCLESFIGTSWQPIGCGCTSAPGTPGAISGPSPLCQGYTNYVYTIAPVAGASTYTWTLPVGASIANGSGTTAITVNLASNTASGAQQVTVTAGNSCGTSAAAALAITVNEIPRITVQPSGTTICGIGALNTGNATFSITTTGTAVTYQWQVNTGSGFANITNGGVYSNATTSSLTITGATPSYSGYQYQCVVSGTCAPTVTSNAVTLTVNPVPAVTTASTASICSGTATSVALTASTPSSFAWTLGTNTGSITTPAAGSGSTIAQTLTNPSNATAGSIVYNVTPTSTTGGCIGNASAITVTVNPKPAVTTATTASICSATATSIALTASAPSSFAWTLGTNTGAITTPAAGSGNTIAQTLTNPSNSTAGSIVYNVTPTATTGACVGNATAITVTVTPTPVVTTANTASICSGTATSIALTSSTPSSFAWTLGTNTGSITTPAAGSGTSIAQTLTNPSSSSNGSIVYNVTPTSTTNSCVGSAYPITVTVNPKPVVTTATTASICSGATTSIALTSSTPGTFAWTLGTNTGSITTPAAGSGSSIAQTLTNPSNSSNGTIVYNVTPTATTGSCVGNATAITVTVTPRPSVTTATTASICSGTATSISLTSSTPSSFAWTLGTNTGSITTPAAGSGSSIAQTLTNPSNTSNGSIVYNVTPTSTTNSCVGSATAITVTVTPRPVVTTASTATICSGTATSIALTSSVPGSFAWTLGTNTGGITTPAAGSGASIAQTLTNPSNSSNGSIVYNVTPTSTTNSCAGTVYPITVTVNPKPAVTTASTASICSGATTSIALTSSTPGTFAWTLGTNTGAITTPAPGSGTSIAQTLTNPSNSTAGSIIYNVTPTATTGSCVGTVYPITVTVTPIPAVTTATTASMCSGATSAIALTASTPSNFAWTLGTNTGGITTPAAGSGSSIAQTLTNPSTTTNGSIAYSVTPTSTTNSCVGGATSITLTVTPRPVVTTASTASICSGTATSIALTSSVPGSFAWTLGTNTGGITTPAAGSGASIAQTLTNPSSTTAGSIVYNVTPTSTTNSCAGTVYPITVTVRPKPVVTVVAGTSPLCIGNSTTLTASPSGGSGTYTTYAWTGSGIASASTSVVGNSATPVASGTQAYTVNVTDNTGCQSSNGSVNVSVNAAVGASISGGTSPNCNNTSAGTFTATGSGGTGSYTYLWYLNNVSTGVTTQTYNPTLTSGSNAIRCAITSGACGTTNSSTTTIGTGPCYSTTGCGSAGNWSSGTYIGANNMTCNNQTTGAVFTPSGGNYFQWDGIAGQTYSLTINPGTGWTTPAWQYWQVVGGVWTYQSQGTGAAVSITPTVTSPYGSGHHLIVIFNGTACPSAAASGNASVTYRRTTGPIPSNATVSNSSWLVYGCTNYTISASAINSCNTDYGGASSGYAIMALVNYQGTSGGNHGGYFAWAPTQALLNINGFTQNQSAVTSGTGWVGMYAGGYGNTTGTLISGSQSVSGYTTTANFVFQPNNTYPHLGATNAVSVYSSDVCGNVNGWTNYQLNFSSSGSSQSFAYTGTIPTFTVPNCVNSITITARGAQGGTSNGNGTVAGGLGASMTGTFAVTPGQQLKILVGGQGGTGTQGGGGGGTFVTNASNAPLIIAGGGGGAYYGGYPSGSGQSAGTTSTTGQNGMTGMTGAQCGAGGAGPNGGGVCATNGVNTGAGGGGLTGNGGQNGTAVGGRSFTNGGAGGAGAGTGGAGGFGGGGGCDWLSWTGGGGGGGYGGGGGGNYYGVGGGGGSYNGGTNQSNAAGSNAGNGSVTITW